MRRTLFASTLSLLVAVLAVSAGAQTPPGAATGRAPQTSTGLRVNVPLPASDAVVRADLKRLLTEAMPHALSGDASKLAQVNADIEQFKSRTGLDARDFDTITVGARIVQLPSGATKVTNAVAVARGTFRPDAVVASMRAAAKGGFAEQKYGGLSVYVITVNDKIKVFGLAKMHVTDFAVAVLDQMTLAAGDPAAVRSAIDAMNGRGHIDQTLLNSVQTPDLIAFAGSVPPGAFGGLETGLPNVDRAVASVRGFRGAVAQTSAGFLLTTVLRTQTAADARQLFDTAQALKQVAPGLISMSGEKGRFAQRAINNLKLTTKGDEVQLTLDVPQADIAELLRVL